MRLNKLPDLIKPDSLCLAVLFNDINRSDRSAFYSLLLDDDQRSLAKLLDGFLRTFFHDIWFFTRREDVLAFGVEQWAIGVLPFMKRVPKRRKGNKKGCTYRVQPN